MSLDFWCHAWAINLIKSLLSWAQKPICLEKLMRKQILGRIGSSIAHLIPNLLNNFLNFFLCGVLSYKITKIYEWQSRQVRYFWNTQGQFGQSIFAILYEILCWSDPFLHIVANFCQRSLMEDAERGRKSCIQSCQRRRQPFLSVAKSFLEDWRKVQWSFVQRKEVFERI